MENITPIMAADPEAMLKHLDMLFGRAMAGKIEITALKAVPKGEKVAPRFAFFSLDQFDEAVEWATNVNADPGWNVYVGAALRRDDVFPGSPADDTDFLEAWAVWADCDDEEQVATARARYQELETRPPFIVVTGRTPGRRAQLWWPLDEPIRDPQVLRVTVRGIADTLESDHGVLTAKQLMRLAGGVSWPKLHKPGRVLEQTELVIPASAEHEFQLARLHKAFPPVQRATRGDFEPSQAPSTLAASLAYSDLRSALAFMPSDDRGEWIRIGHALKTLGEVGKSLWIEWSSKSPEFDADDIDERWDGFHPTQTGYQAVFAEAQRRGWVNPGRGSSDLGNVNSPLMREVTDPETGEVTEVEVEDLFEVLSIADLKALPDAAWIFKDAIPAQALGFIYGPPASFKSFLCYDLALRLAHGGNEWLGHEAKAQGAVLYIASEGISGAKSRIEAWQRANKVTVDTTAFHLIRKTINFMSPDDMERLDRTVKAHIAQHGPVALVFVDTVSRVLPGADENLQKDMTVFIAACDRLREYGCTVVGVHHTNKAGEMRGSTVFLGQGDFIYRVERTEKTLSGVITCEKQKEAEDGWKRVYSVRQEVWVPAGKIEATGSLVVEYGGAPEAVESTDDWPSREACKDILKDIQEAWNKGKPWSPHARARTEGRYAVVNISKSHGVAASTVQMMIEAWLRTETLVLDEHNSHAKTKGLRVEKWLD